MFKGTYHYKVDPKGRLPVPAPFRRLLQATGRDSLVVTLLDQCLAVFPSAEWVQLEQRLRSLPSFTRPVKALARHLASRAVDRSLDVQGRILLPPSLRQAVGLDRDAVVVGVIDRFEVWRPSHWEDFLRDSERLLDDVSFEVPWPIPGPSAPEKPVPARRRSTRET